MARRVLLLRRGAGAVEVGIPDAAGDVGVLGQVEGRGQDAGMRPAPVSRPHRARQGTPPAGMTRGLSLPWRSGAAVASPPEALAGPQSFGRARRDRVAVAAQRLRRGFDECVGRFDGGAADACRSPAGQVAGRDRPAFPDRGCGPLPAYRDPRRRRLRHETRPRRPHDRPSTSPGPSQVASAPAAPVARHRGTSGRRTLLRRRSRIAPAPRPGPGPGLPRHLGAASATSLS